MEIDRLQLILVVAQMRDRGVGLDRLRAARRLQPLFEVHRLVDRG